MALPANIEALEKKDSLPAPQAESTEGNDLFEILTKAQLEMEMAGTDTINYFKSRYADIVYIVTGQFSRLGYYIENEESALETFSSEEDAIYALYEQLFDSLNSVCPSTILNAMKYLLEKKDMSKQMEEISHMHPEDVCVVHHRQSDKLAEEATKEIKKQLYAILEDKIF